MCIGCLKLDERRANETGMLKYPLVIQKCIHTIELCWVSNAVFLIIISIGQASLYTAKRNAE